MSSILIFRGNRRGNNVALNLSILGGVLRRARSYPTARGYCAAINHSRAHKRILHPPQSHSRYVFSIDAAERDAKR